MKSFIVVSVVVLAALGTLPAPRPAHAQWTKGMTRIKKYPYSSDPSVTAALDVKGNSQYAPESDISNPLVLTASSQRGDGEDSAYVHNLTYTAVQEFNWSFQYQGPPTPNFKTDISSSIGGDAGPSQDSVPTSAPVDQQIGKAYCTISVGQLGGAGGNDREGGGAPLPFVAPVYSRTTPVTVEHQTSPTVNIYHAECGIGMTATTDADFVIASEDDTPVGPPGGPVGMFLFGKSNFLASMAGKYHSFCPGSGTTTYHGKGCHANCHGTLSFGDPY